MKKIVINGRFLSQKITGVQRFAHEIIRELDKMANDYSFYIKIIAPQNIIYELEYLINIKLIKRGLFKGHLWEQLELPFFVSKDEILISLCNTSPILRPHIITIHDIQAKVFPNFFSKKFSVWYNFLNYWNLKNSKKIITVSNFSKQEIIENYNISQDKISVIYNGWQHINRIDINEGILSKYKLEKKKYFFAVGSLNPNKNFEFIVEISKQVPFEQFVIAGNINDEIFKETNISQEVFKNVLYLGFISDVELKSLYTFSKALIYPSFYEGFGIPPLEALACGTDIIISNTSSLPEVFGKSATYIDPYNHNTFSGVENVLEANKKKTLATYSWKISAEKLLEIIKIE